MGNSSRPPQRYAPRLSVTPAVSANADSLTSTFPIIRHTVCLAGVWGEASPQSAMGGGARSEKGQVTMGGGEE